MYHVILLAMIDKYKENSSFKEFHKSNAIKPVLFPSKNLARYLFMGPIRDENHSDSALNSCGYVTLQIESSCTE